MRLAMPVVGLILVASLPFALVGCWGDTGTIQEQILTKYPDKPTMGSAVDAMETK
jgi:hypothetical protein